MKCIYEHLIKSFSIERFPDIIIIQNVLLKYHKTFLCVDFDSNKNW